ncbi:kinase-like domain-containing protein [Mycena pura]|uniref:Kinase-like domain-containing protein n=1 Tax=Mycena pura TaxID=153505 RepID=A0AAD7E4S5_9AGAR|nr:kinase-like domain-containing protein [Mycena pura]
MEECYENSSCYGPGGLCPVRVGDLLGPDPPRYRVAAKLGWGSYATVWLARDIVGSKTVALKIVEAASSQGSTEAAILGRLRAPPSVEPLVLQLFDAFTVTSPNGVHQVLVTEPVMLLQDYLSLPGRRMTTRALMRQVVEGVAFMHARGIAHGGESPTNIGVALPEPDAFSEIKLWKRIGAPDVIPLLASDPTRDPASFPPYICEALDLTEFVRQWVPDFATRSPPRARILDLGSAYAVDDSPPPPCGCPLLFRPPEVIFQQLLDRANSGPWDCRSDIWSLACLLYEIATGGCLFGGSMGASLNDSHLKRLARASGSLPDAWAKHLSISATQYTSELADEFWKEREISDKTIEDGLGLLQLLRRMLVIDPARRPTAEEVLRDPYFDGLQDPGVGVELDPAFTRYS